MPLTQQECQKIGQAIASQLQGIVGGGPEASYDDAPKSSYPKSAEAIGKEYQGELVGLVKELVSDLKAAGHIPNSKELTEAVIIVA